MYKMIASNIELGIDINKGQVLSLILNGKERCVCPCPIFNARFRNKDGKCYYVNSATAESAVRRGEKLIYSDFEGAFKSIIVTVTVKASDNISWEITIENVPNEYALEWVEFPKICLPRLADNDKNGGKILFPYDEGILISDETLLPRYEPEFPMSGSYFIFPNKVCSQFMAYLFDDVGLYIGAHDKQRGFKGVDFYRHENGISMQIRLYSGVDYGQNYKSSFPVIWCACDSDWKSATSIYRAWFEENLPTNLVKISQNKALPDWYKESPLIVTYPVRGIHDMDKMEPNALFPYTNALPLIKKIKNATSARIMALLMHWEGTAPWAPPYVWPPYGGIELFNEFRDELHKSGDLLGVYCSGFGYTLRSTLIESYDCEEKIKQDNVLKGVCHSPENKPELGITCCPYQRYGYDICPASTRGREILNEAYEPLFKSGVDYAQILDQNHGGGQYMCFARNHDHPPMPGEWMTSNMQRLLGNWNEAAPNMLFGCESAASEPFIGNMLMSDNRFELNYPFGTPVPVYAFIYHEYVRNFMGNQCGCPFEPACDTLRYRLAYSFSIGDIMTLVLAPNGELMTHWSTRDFEHCPDMKKALLFIKNMISFYNNGASRYLYNGRMCKGMEISCESITIPLYRGRESATLPRLLSSCWEADNGRVAYIVVNPEDTPVSFSIEGEHFDVPALNALLIVK